MNALTSLNAGSGIDVKAMTEELLAAERAPRQQRIDSRLERVEAQISALGQFRSALDAMVSAVDKRIATGELSGQPMVSNPALVGLSIKPGTLLEPQTIEVQQMARGQALASAAFADAEASIGNGNLTIRFGNVAGSTEATGFTPSDLADLSIEIDESNNSLIGIRDAINKAAAESGSPVQARIISDGDGMRLMLSGKTGEAHGFIVEATGDPALSAFSFGEGESGLQRTQTATNAIVALDGLPVQRASNEITDLIPGATINLIKASPGEQVVVSARHSPIGLSETVVDIAAALNELRNIGAEFTRSNPGSPGALSSDPAARRAMQNLTGITSIQLIEPAGDAPTRLSEIGLSIDRNGKFNIDQERLNKAVTNHPEAVEALISALNRKAGPGQPAGPLRDIADSFRQSGSSIRGSALEATKAALEREQKALDASLERKREAYVRQFAALDRAVGQSKALQTYLQQQIDLWTKPQR